MRPTGISLPERFHHQGEDPPPLRRFLPRRLGSIFVVLAVLGLIGFEGRSIWLQVAISWVLFSAVIRWIGFLIGSNSVR